MLWQWSWAPCATFKCWYFANFSRKPEICANSQSNPAYEVLAFKLVISNSWWCFHIHSWLALHRLRCPCMQCSPNCQLCAISSENMSHKRCSQTAWMHEQEQRIGEAMGGSLFCLKLNLSCLSKPTKLGSWSKGATKNKRGGGVVWCGVAVSRKETVRKQWEQGSHTGLELNYLFSDQQNSTATHRDGRRRISAPLCPSSSTAY